MWLRLWKIHERYPWWRRNKLRKIAKRYRQLCGKNERCKEKWWVAMFIHDSPPSCHMSIPFSIWPIRWYCRSTNPSSTGAGKAWRRNVVGLVDVYVVLCFCAYVLQCIHSIRTNRASLLDLQDPAIFNQLNLVQAFITAWYHLQFISILYMIWYKIIWVRFFIPRFVYSVTSSALKFRFQAQPQAHNRPGGWMEKKGENDLFPKVLNCCNLMSFVWICDVLLMVVSESYCWNSSTTWSSNWILGCFCSFGQYVLFSTSHYSCGDC